MTLFPALKDEIQEVAAHGSFGVEDTPWIASTIGMQLRVTIETRTWDAIHKHGLEVPQNFWTGLSRNPDVTAHLLFSWANLDSDRPVGHWDLLQPSKQQICSSLNMHLPRDDARLSFTHIFSFLKVHSRHSSQ